MDKRKKIKRIAIVSRLVSGFTGTTTTILEHTRRLKDSGWEVHVFGEKLAAGRIAAAGGESHLLPRWPIGSFFKRRLFAWLFQREIRGESFDLVRGHGDTLSQDVLCLHNCVHATHEAVHGTPLPRSSGVGRIHSRILHEQGFKLLVANSELTKREVIKRFGVPESKVSVVHPGYDPKRFNPDDRPMGAAIRADMGLAKEDILVGIITSGDFKKRGVGIFLASLRRLPESIKKKMHVVVLGQETKLKPYQELAGQAGMGDRIRFMPPDPAIEKYFHALDIYVHPALYEEFGQSVQEAMACGLPVLTNRRVGAAELLAGDATGLVLEVPEEKALALSLERLVKDPVLRAGFAREGLQACRENTWDANYTKHAQLYERLLADMPG